MLEEDGPRNDPWLLDPPEMRRYFLNSLASELEEYSDEKTRPHHTLAYRLLEDLTQRVLSEHSRATPSSRDLFDKLGRARDLVDQLMYAALPHEQSPRPPRGNFWQHAARPEWTIRDKSYQLLIKPEVEGAASFYLAQPLRSALYDRVLVDMLIALEMYQYVSEVFHPYTVPGIPSQSPMRQMHPLLTTFIEIVVVIGVIWLSLIGTSYLDPQGGWSGWVVGAASLIGALIVIWDVLTLPARWISWRRAREIANKILASMLTTYQSMHSDSVISASHVLDRVKAAASEGVVWPSPLYVVLEDVIARGGRL